MHLARSLAAAVLATAGVSSAVGAGPLDAYIVGEVRPPQAIEDVTALAALPAAGAKIARYRLIGAGEDEAAPRSRTLTIDASVETVGPAHAGSGWMVVLEDVETLVLVRDEDEGLRRPLVGDLAHETTLMPNPALPVLPATLEPAQAFEERGRAIVVGKVAEDGRLFVGPDDLQVHGGWAVSIEHDADVTLQVPAGRFECKRIRTRTTLTLKGASLETTSIAYYAPRAGLVAEERRPRTVAGKVQDERIGALLPVQPAWAMVLTSVEPPLDPF